MAFLLVFSSFGVGLRCFSDFDKGLKDAKTGSKPSVKVISLLHVNLTPRWPGTNKAEECS